MRSAEGEDLLTIKEAADLLSVSEQTLRRWDRSGKLRAVRHPGNGYRLYPRADVEALGAGGPGASATEPARPRTNLGAPLTSFVGRASELAALSSAFARGARFVTIVGPPGSGKTRLARRFAEREGAPFLEAGGVWFCDASDVVEEVDLRGAIAAALGLRSAPPLALLAEGLARRGRVLLLVGHAERVGEEARRALHRVADLAPEARVLVASRARLHVEGETVVEIGPLGLPREGDDAAAILASDAVHLLRDRSGGPLTDADDVAALVRALDGLPLAIEIVAPRLRLSSPRELLSQLDGRLDFSRDGAAGSPPAAGRHASLRTALDASWSALPEDARRALGQCAVFAGGFTSDAAEAVLDPLGAGHADVEAARRAVTALRDASLVAIHPASGAAARRFVLFEGVRAHAAERLVGSGAAPATEARHAAHYVARAEGCLEAVRRSGDLAARRSVCAEQQNLAAAYRRALAAGDGATAARAALCLELPLSMSSRFRELRALLEEALTVAAAAPLDVRARLLVGRAHVYGATGKIDESLQALEHALAVAIATHDPSIEGEARILLMVRYRLAARFDDAVACGERAREVLAGAGHAHLEATARVNLGLVLGELGRVAEARAHDEAARATFSTIGDGWSEGLALGNLAQLDQERGAFDSASFFYQETLRVFREAGDLLYEAVYVGFAATLAHERLVAGAGEQALRDARAGYAAAIATMQLGGVLHLEGLMHAFAGALEAAHGDRERARAELDRAGVLVGTTAVPGHVASLALLRTLLESSAERVAALETARASAAQSPSSALRTSIRLVVASLAAADPATSPSGAWALGPAGRWATPPGGARISLDRRGPLRRILVALVAARAASPGIGLSRDALLAAGWPGERVHPDAAGKRVRVAVATLRELGLRPVLLTRDDGYFLDPASTWSTAADL